MICSWARIVSGSFLYPLEYKNIPWNLYSSLPGIESACSVFDGLEDCICVMNPCATSHAPSLLADGINFIKDDDVQTTVSTKLVREEITLKVII